MLRVLVLLLAMALPALAVEGGVCVENASIDELADALAAGKTSAADLVRAYTARIEAYDRAGPRLNAVRELNPEALAIAERLDAQKPAQRRPLEGIPILLKDNIATGDAQHTTAGSLALADAQAVRDATVAQRLRDAGAVILGKANLTEFANILAIDMPAGYSSLGGQVRNPFAPALDDKGIPLVSPGGSSAGSAVAVAAGLAAAAIGTETSGSLLSPANQNGVVTVKPTVGLISRAGIIPIAHSQDTAGPLTRTVRDAAILLNVLAAQDPSDEATRALQRPADYTAVLDKDGLRGARIGIPSDPDDPANDVYYGRLPPRAAAIMSNAIAVLRSGRRRSGARQHSHHRLDGRTRHRRPHSQPQSGKPDLQPDGAASDRLPLRAQARPQRLSARLGQGHQHAHLGGHHRLQRCQCRARSCASVRTSSSPRRRRGAISARPNTLRRGKWTSLPPARSGSMPIWTATSSMPSCFPAATAPPSRPRPAIPACRCLPE